MNSNAQPPDDDVLILEFNEAWDLQMKGGERPKLENYVSPVIPPVAQLTRLRNLLRVEVRHRLRLGEKPHINDYVERMPNFRELLQQEFSNLTSLCDAQLEDTLVQPNERDPERAPELPRQIGGYRIVRLLGEGAFGQVYLAIDSELERHVAIKVPHAKLLADSHVQSLREEARNLAKLEHPAIVRVLHVGLDAERFFIVTEYVEGGDLKARLQQGKYSSTEAAVLVRKVAEGLHYAHKMGFVHRDLKPANILLDRDGAPRIADFGLALKDSDFGKGPRIAGTLAYMSPEQAREESHRVDGRSDIFSLGIVLYELLVNQLPFRGDNVDEILDLIINVEPRPPRQIDDSLPRELERICLKALSKRATDRYSCARDMAEDLKAFLEHETTQSLVTNPSSSSSVRIGMMVVPKGLRSFNAEDADYFLRLLPGPFDREGLPEAIRFWKVRIEGIGSTPSFAVGVVYGPSGCGKSSLVRAGLLPRLADHVIPLYLEASPSSTEQHLVELVQRRFSLDPEQSNLHDALTQLRDGDSLGQKKLLIVLDQFEQWLHANTSDARTELVRALRQCDGDNVQCLLIVRDDFWLALSRFMNELETPLHEGANSLLVDLFEIQHAQRVLRCLGTAYDRLPEDRYTETHAQRRFVEQAVAMLASEGRVFPVQLATFVEMLKNSEWRPETLKRFGGTTGVGLAFLEETFDSSSTLTKHRIHREAAKGVLESLLPESGANLKGHMRSRAQLLRDSGYGDDDTSFDELMRILDGELRLITPCDSPKDGTAQSDIAGSPVTDRTVSHYQLTHDYLVPSLREWLTRSKAATAKGRTELLLSERASQWSERRDPRFLPKFREYVSIGFWTRKSQRTKQQNLMMKRASRVYLSRSAAVAAVALLLLSVFWYFQRANRIRNLAHNLLISSPEEVLATANKLDSYRPYVDQTLTEQLKNAEESKKLHYHVALLPQEDAQRRVVDALLTKNHEDDTGYFMLARDALQVRLPRDAFRSVISTLSARIDKDADQPRDVRFRAACAVARYRPDLIEEPSIREAIVEEFVRLDRLERRAWGQVLAKELPSLRETLLQVFLEADPNSVRRDNAFDLLTAEFPRDDVILDIIADAEISELSSLLPLPENVLWIKALKKRRQDAAAELTSIHDKSQEQLLPVACDRDTLLATIKELRRKIKILELTPQDSDQVAHDLLEVEGTLRSHEAELVEWTSLLEKHHEDLNKEVRRLTVRQANIAVALLTTSSGCNQVWPLLRNPTESESKHDIEVRTEIIHRILATKLDATHLTHRLEDLVAQFKSGKSIYDSELRALILAHGSAPAAGQAALSNSLSSVLQQLHRTHPDPGVHGAVEWLMRKLDVEIKPPTVSSNDDSESMMRWSVNKQGQTFAKLPGGEFEMGSPEEERYRDTEMVETIDSTGKVLRNIEYQRKESVGPFRIALREVTVAEFRQFFPDYTPLSLEGLSTSDDDPAHGISWSDAGKYCNAVSKAEGLSEREWAYNEDKKEFDISKKGFRLPTSAEWEYACRSETTTSRFFGTSDELLPVYAWYVRNSMKARFSPVGDHMPNDFGLFDTLGNVTEWCTDVFVLEDGREFQVARGGAYDDNGRFLRSALVLGIRKEEQEGETIGSMGFRLAQTIRDD